MNPKLLTCAGGLVIFALSYFIGSIPWGYLMGRFNGIDIRNYGSHNIGATNVRRVLGAGWSNLCFALDFLKGLLPVLYLGHSLGGSWSIGSDWGGILAAAGAVVGHVFTCWLGFKGGKGVATSLGAALALAPVPVLIGLVVWVIMFYSTRVVAIASIGAICTIAIAALLMRIFAWGQIATHTVVLLIIIALVVVARHSDNIRRLLQGTENAFQKLRNKDDDGEETEQAPKKKPHPNKKMHKNHKRR
ncbi:MAG: glycerol-3-phosphate 1-O-acyltransferase PlsY [Victivallales bacterium]|nr:glycerol-3-phosphate 1-O-acyltransferase PlsY [Victivallales bacterium]